MHDIDSEPQPRRKFYPATPVLPTHMVCKRCGYDLREHRRDNARCPECGLPVVESLRKHAFSRRRVIRTATKIVAAILLVLVGVAFTRKAMRQIRLEDELRRHNFYNIP